MKRFFTTIFISLLAFSFSQAQSIDIPDDSLSYSSNDLTLFEYVVESKLMNNTSSDVDYIWRKQLMDCEDGWTMSMCIGELCYRPEVDTEDEVLKGAEGKWSLHLANTMGETGYCNVCVDFWAIGDTDTLTNCTFFELGTSSNNEELNAYNVSFYPNPVNNVLSVEVDRRMEIVINNALGQLEYKKVVNSGVHNVLMDQYRKGLYTISFVVDGEIIMTRKLIKN